VPASTCHEIRRFAFEKSVHSALTNNVWDLCWYLHADFHEAAILSSLIPRDLEHNLTRSSLCNSVYTRSAIPHQPLQLPSRSLWVAVEQIRAEQFLSTLGTKRFDRFLVQLQDYACRITDLDCSGEFFNPTVFSVSHQVCLLTPDLYPRIRKLLLIRTFCSKVSACEKTRRILGRVTLNLGLV
jgi:hypothetical protein